MDISMSNTIEPVHNNNTVWSPLSLWDPRPTDLTLVVDSRKFHLHKDVLIKSSDYFSAMFSSQMKEATKDIIDLYLPESVDSEHFRFLIEDLYTGELKITKSNVFGLVQIAQMLHVCPALLSTYINFMKHNLINETHCFELMYFCVSLNIQELYCDTRRFCLAHFSELRHSKSFSNLSLSELYDYLSDKCLVVDNEVNVVKAIHKWVSANTCNIHPNTDKYDILKTQIKKLVSTCVLVQGNDGAHDSITEAIFRSGCLQTEQFQGSLAKRTRQEDVFMFWSLLSPTNPDGLVTIAKFSLETGVGVKFDSMTDIVEKPGFNLSSALCVSGPYVYLSGGGPAFGKINWIKQVWMFDMSKPCSRWVTVCDLIEFRRSHAMVIVGKKLYIFGGFGKFRCKNTQLHSLDLVKGEWEALPPTPTHEINPVATTFDNKIFYICKDWMVYSFDTITKVWTGWNQWETVPHRPPVETKPIAIFPVKSGDSDCFAVVAFTDNCIQIPLICLLRGAVKLHTNEENIAKVTNPFTYAGSVAINGKVAVFLTCAKIEDNFYGENEINSIHKVMIFDPETNLMNDFLPVQNVKKAQSILAVPYFPTTFKMGALDFK